MSGKVKVVLLVGVMYGLGVASGILWQHRHDPRNFWKSTDFIERRVKKLTNRLHLTPEQSQATREIIQKTHERGKIAHDHMMQEMAVIHRDSMQSIRQVLRPDQTAEFEKMHENYHAHHKDLPADDLK